MYFWPWLTKNMPLILSNDCPNHATRGISHPCRMSNNRGVEDGDEEKKYLMRVSRQQNKPLTLLRSNIRWNGIVRGICTVAKNNGLAPHRNNLCKCNIYNLAVRCIVFQMTSSEAGSIFPASSHSLLHECYRKNSWTQRQKRHLYESPPHVYRNLWLQLYVSLQV